MKKSFWKSLKTGTWPRAELIKIAAWMAVFSYTVLIIFYYSPFGVALSKNGFIPTSDFLSFWSSAKTALKGFPELAYMPEEFERLQAPYMPAGSYYAFFYPPMFQLIILPLAMFHGLVAFILFQLVTILCSGFVLVLIMRSWNGLLMLLALPASLNVMLHGQNSFLTSALLGGALFLLMSRRQLAAGVCIGLMTFKPQMGILIPLVLIAAGYWRCICSATLTTVVFAATSWIVLGNEAWLSFLEQAPFARETMESGYVDYHKFVSIFAAVRLWGGEVWIAYVLQGAFSVMATIYSWKVWRSSICFEVKAIVLGSCMLLMTPFLLSYDLAILCVPLCFWVRYSEQRGQANWTLALAMLAVIVSALSRAVSGAFLIPIGPLAPLCVMAIGWFCVVQESQKVAIGQKAASDPVLKAAREMQ